VIALLIPIIQIIKRSGKNPPHVSQSPNQPRGFGPAPFNQKGKTMKPAYNEEAVEAAKEQTTGNRLKFKLEFMIMMLNCDRTEEAGKMYDQLIEEFDKLA
jgi:hypothetical protein